MAIENEEGLASQMDEEFNEDELDEEIVDEDDDSDDDVEDSESDDDSSGDGADDFELEIELGDEVIKFDSEGIKDAVQRSREYDELKRKYESIEQDSQRSAALSKFVSSDPLSSAIISYKSRGISDEEIVRALYTHMGLQETNKDSEAELNEDGTPNIEKMIDTRMASLKRENDELRQRYESDTNLAHNDQVFAAGLEASGFNGPVTESHLHAVDKAMKELYPNVDIRRQRLTPKQVAAIIREANIGGSTDSGDDTKTSGKASGKAQKVRQAKGKKSPVKMTRGSKGSSKSRSDDKREGVTLEERAANYDKIFG